MRQTSKRHDRRSEQSANAALLAIMLLITSGASLQLQTSGGRSTAASNRDTLIHGVHVTAFSPLGSAGYVEMGWTTEDEGAINEPVVREAAARRHGGPTAAAWRRSVGARA